MPAIVFNGRMQHRKMDRLLFYNLHSERWITLYLSKTLLATPSLYNTLWKTLHTLEGAMKTENYFWKILVIIISILSSPFLVHLATLVTCPERFFRYFHILSKFFCQIAIFDTWKAVKLVQIWNHFRSDAKTWSFQFRLQLQYQTWPMHPRPDC